MTRILVFGQPFWGSRIADAVNQHGRDLDATFVPQRDYPLVLARPPREQPTVILRSGFRVGSPTWRGRIFEEFWTALVRRLPDAVRCHYWHGSDVMNLVEEVRSGAARLGPLRRAMGDLHVADAPWLAEELRSIDIEATVVKVPSSVRTPIEPPPMPRQFSLLTYLPAARFEFYGGPLVLDAARSLPHIRVVVVGADGAGLDSPPNVEWCGWVPDLAQHYARASVLVRVPVHDGLGTMVVEALFNARHVIYTYEVPHVRYLAQRTSLALASEIDALFKTHSDGSLGLNLAGRAYASEHFSEPVLVAQFERAIKSRL